MGKMGIYEIRNNITGKFYIGSSCNLRRRKRDHINRLRNNSHDNNHLQYSWNKHGEHNFSFNELQFVKNRDDLMDIEQEWLDKTKCYQQDIGYNIARFADTNFRRLSNEDILNIATLHRKGEHYKKIAKVVGVSIATVHDIKSGNIYRDITSLPKVNYKVNKLEEHEVLFISRTCRKAVKKGVTISLITNQLIKEFGISSYTIYDISSGVTWQEITGNKGPLTKRKKKLINDIETQTPPTQPDNRLKQNNKRVVEKPKAQREVKIKDIWKDITSDVDQDLIAERHSITRRYINRLITGEIYSSVTGVKYKRQRLTEKEVVSIYAKKLSGGKTMELAKEFNVSRPTIDRIANRSIWKDITKDISI